MLIIAIVCACAVVSAIMGYRRARKHDVRVCVVNTYVSCEGMYVDMDARDAYMQDMRKEMV